MADNLPEAQRAMVLYANHDILVQKVPVPSPTPGSAVVRVLSAGIVTYMPDIYNGKRNYPYPTPMIPGASAICRVVAVGPDATSLSPGQLVLVDCTVRGRDEPTFSILIGVHEGHNEGSRKLMHGEWRNGVFAEYAKAPLENCIAMDEKRLLGSKQEGGLGYTVQDLTTITSLLIPYGGLRDIGLKVGETIIIAPATGGFGGAAVHIALAMGARVIAMGRNVEALNRLAARSDRVHAVPITGDVEADTKALRSFGPIHAYLDLSPPTATKSTHIKSAIMAMSHGGRISLMGGVDADIPIPLAVVMHNELQLKGKFMYDRDGILDALKMVDVGILLLGEAAGIKTLSYSLEDWETAFKKAETNPGIDVQVVFSP